MKKFIVKYQYVMEGTIEIEANTKSEINVDKLISQLEFGEYEYKISPIKIKKIDKIK